MDQISRVLTRCIPVNQLPAKAHHTAFAVVLFARNVGGLAVQNVKPRQPVRRPSDGRGADGRQGNVLHPWRPPPAPFTRDPPSILTKAIGAPRNSGSRNSRIS